MTALVLSIFSNNATCHQSSLVTLPHIFADNNGMLCLRQIFIDIFSMNIPFTDTTHIICIHLMRGIIMYALNECAHTFSFPFTSLIVDFCQFCRWILCAIISIDILM